MHLKVCKIPITDLECVTNTQFKGGGPVWYLNIKKGILYAEPIHVISTDELSRSCKVRGQDVE